MASKQKILRNVSCNYVSTILSSTDRLGWLKIQSIITGRTVYSIWSSCSRRIFRSKRIACIQYWETWGTFLRRRQYWENIEGSFALCASSSLPSPHGKHSSHDTSQHHTEVQRAKIAHHNDNGWVACFEDRRMFSSSPFAKKKKNTIFGVNKRVLEFVNYASGLTVMASIERVPTFRLRHCYLAFCSSIDYNRVWLNGKLNL